MADLGRDANASELLSEAPKIEMVELLAVKLPG